MNMIKLVAGTTYISLMLVCFMPATTSVNEQASAKILSYDMHQVSDDLNSNEELICLDHSYEEFETPEMSSSSPDESNANLVTDEELSDSNVCSPEDYLK